MWFAQPASPIRYAVSDGSGHLLLFSDSEVAGHSYTLQFSDGSRLQVRAATSGPGQRGKSMTYQGYSLHILSWYDDGSPAAVRASGPDGEVAELQLPAPASAPAPQSSRSRALAAASVTDPCPPMRDGDENWPDTEAENRHLRHAACRIGMDALLRGHPTLWLSAELMDWIAGRVEVKVRGFNKVFRQDLPSAWQRSKNLVAKLPARMAQALERANGTLRVPDVLLNVGVRSSQQQLPSEEQEAVLVRLADDLRSLQPGQVPTSLRTLDAGKLAKPSAGYTPSPAPTLAATSTPSSPPPVLVRETPPAPKPALRPKLADWAGTYRLQGAGIVLEVVVNDQGAVTRCATLELVVCQGRLQVNADGSAASLQLSGNDGESPIDTSGSLTATITPDGIVTGSFEAHSVSEGPLRGTLNGNRHEDIDALRMKPAPAGDNIHPVPVPVGTPDKDGCFQADHCVASSSRWSSSGKSFQITLRNSCARVYYRLATRLKNGSLREEADGIRDGGSATSTLYDASGKYTYKAVGSLKLSNDWVCASKVKGWNDAMNPK